jgi:hypothetical protein
MPDPQYDMIGIKLADACAAALADPAGPLAAGFAQLCECIKNYAQQPGSMPCGAFPFNYSRSVVQTVVCHVATTVMQVPKGLTGVITRIAFQERYPGTLYGANFMLLVNDNLSPWFPRQDIPAGEASGAGLGTRICLEEQDIVSILIQCSWTPVVYVGQESTDQQTLFPFQMSGYYQNKEVEIVE